ncbi:hypothetical protein Tco_0828078 [Tanacetum coccineum]
MGKEQYILYSTARPISTARPVSTARPFALKIAQTGNAIRPIYPRTDNGHLDSILQDHALVDSGCSSHMTGNKAYLSYPRDYNGGFVAFGSDPKRGKSTGQHLVLPDLVSVAQKHLTMVLMIGLGQRCSLDWI